ncbi:MAG TPA: hypothetical protein PLB25_17060, partial [Rhodoferax sp.]|nr:hypothetical protein [Rhodoferax sp.]
AFSGSQFLKPPALPGDGYKLYDLHFHVPEVGYIQAAALGFQCIWLTWCAVTKMCLTIECLDQWCFLTDGSNASRANKHGAQARTNQAGIIGIRHSAFK